MPQKDFELILRVQADLQQAVSQLRTLNDQMRVTKSAAVEASGGLATIRGSAAAAESGIRNVGTQATALNSKLGLINRTAHDLRNAFIFAFAIHEVVDFTKSLVDANVEAQRIQFTLQQVFGAGAAQQYDFVREAAQKLGLDLKSAAEGYANLAASAQGTGVQTADLQKLFTGLSEAATVLHASASDVNGVMVQLAQGISLGKLQMQDIRAIAQHLPGTMTLVSEAAKRMGTDINTALKSGGLDAQRFIGILGDVLHERFGVQAVEASHSLNAELNRLRNTFFEVQTDGTGFADQFAGAIRSINTELSDPAIQQSLKDLITGFGDIASAAIEAAGKIGQMMSGIASMARYAAFLKTGYIDQDQTLVQQENEFNALVAKRERLKQSLSDLTWVERKLGLGGHLEGELADVTKQIRAAQDARKASQIAQGQAQQQTIDAGAGSVIDGILAPPTPKQGTPATPDPAALRRAGELAKQAAAAQDALTKSLIDMQAQLDPTAAIYAKYNDAVKKATDDAELAKQAHGANTQAIDAQRDAVIALAAKVRDAALDQLAEKDRQAWEALKRSFETPAQVRVEDALKQIQQLNDSLAKGVITAQQYHDALAQIGQKSVAGALPQYQGVDAAVGGPAGELQKNYQAQAALMAAYEAQKAALQKQFDDADEAQHAAHIAALNKLDEDRAAQQHLIDQARGQLQLATAADLFGQLAALSSSQNRKVAAVGKAAAIAQALITTYKNATIAYGEGLEAGGPYAGPALGAVYAAVAVAAGLVNVAQIRSQNVSGYKGGGAIQGPGTGTSDSVPILASNGEYMHNAAAVQYYGIPMMDAINRRMFPRFAEGGLIHPLANAPSPAALGFAAPTPLPIGSLPSATPNDDAHARRPLAIRNVLVMDPDVVPSAMAGQRGERVTMTHIKANIPTLRAWINGKG